MTQGRLATASGFRSYRDIMLIERGRNKLRLVASRDRLARGFRLTRDEFSDYLAGDLALETAVTSFLARATPPDTQRTTAA